MNQEPFSTRESKLLFDGKDWRFLGLITVIAGAISARAILNCSYIGQDFVSHFSLMKSYPAGYSYYFTNPPGLYWFGSLIRRQVGADHDLEFISFAFLLLNLAGLWLLYRLLWLSLALRPLRYAAAAFLTFVPFRMIHAIVFASDAFTIPIFAAAATFTLRLYEDPRRPLAWLGLLLSLLAGMICKYSFVGILPPIALVLAVALWRRLLRPTIPYRVLVAWGLVGLVVLALPTWLFLDQIHKSREVRGFTTVGQWLRPQDPAVMRWQDILTLQKSDVGIFSAPQYFQDKLFGFRKFSYAALIHISAVTDCSNFFQKLPSELEGKKSQREDNYFVRDRTHRAQVLQEWAVRWCLPFTVLAVAGTLVGGLLSFHSFFSSRPSLPDAAVIATALAAGFYSMIFFSLTRISDPYTAGYWLPRLVLPGLLVFYGLGFVLLDLLGRSWPPGRAKAFFFNAVGAYTAVACALFIGFLV